MKQIKLLITWIKKLLWLISYLDLLEETLRLRYYNQSVNTVLFLKAYETH